MNYPIVKVTTQDGYTFHGLFSEPKQKGQTIVIHFHGSAGNFYFNGFYPYLIKLSNELNIAFLSTNSRGSDVYSVETGTKYTGAAIDMSEDSALSNILPLGQNKEFTNFKKIMVPILGVVGDTNECTVIPPKAAVD